MVGVLIQFVVPLFGCAYAAVISAHSHTDVVTLSVIVQVYSFKTSFSFHLLK